MVHDGKNAVTPKIKKEEYTADVLLDILQGYKRQIERDNGRHPSAVLSDILASVNYVLENCER